MQTEHAAVHTFQHSNGTIICVFDIIKQEQSLWTATIDGLTYSVMFHVGQQCNADEFLRRTVAMSSKYKQRIREALDAFQSL